MYWAKSGAGIVHTVVFSVAALCALAAPWILPRVWRQCRSRCHRERVLATSASSMPQNMKTTTTDLSEPMLSASQRQHRREEALVSVAAPAATRRWKLRACSALIAVLEIAGFLMFMMIVVCSFATTKVPCDDKMLALWNAVVAIKDVWFAKPLTLPASLVDILRHSFGDVALVLLARFLLAVLVPLAMKISRAACCLAGCCQCCCRCCGSCDRRGGAEFALVFFDVLAVGCAGAKLYLYELPLADAYATMKACVLVGFCVFSVYHLELHLMLLADVVRRPAAGMSAQVGSTKSSEAGSGSDNGISGAPIRASVTASFNIHTGGATDVEQGGHEGVEPSRLYSTIESAAKASLPPLMGASERPAPTVEKTDSSLAPIGGKPSRASFEYAGKPSRASFEYVVPPAPSSRSSFCPETKQNLLSDVEDMFQSLLRHDPSGK